MVMNVQTWDGVIGGPESAPSVIIADSQLNFSPTLSTFGGYADLLPDNGGWLFLNLHLWPVANRTDTGNSAILDQMIAGTHDSKMRLLGARLKTAFTALGHPITRLVVCPCAEANRRGPFQVYTSTGLKWQAAVSRAIDQIRTGASEPDMRFMMVVARRQHVGPWSSWVPTNVSAVGMMFAPGIGVNTQAKLDQFLDGSLDSGYGYTTDMQNYSADKGIPMALAKWGPRFEWGETSAEQQACPIADLVVNDVYNKLVNKYRDRFLVDCMNVSQLLDPVGYQGPDAAGKAAWSRARTAFITLWRGTGIPSTLTKPVLVNPPVATGSIVQGNTLSVTTGTWSGIPSAYYYLWHRDGVAIAGADQPTYLTVLADIDKTITCWVSAANSAGSTAAQSNGIDVVAPPVVGGAPVNTVAPVISGGTAVGSVLTTTNGTWVGTVTGYDYHWQRNGVDILPSGPWTSSTYTTVEADAGKLITCVVAALNGSVFTPSTSNQILVDSGTSTPEFVKYPPAITGTIRSVSTETQLTDALAASVPGDAIRLSSRVWNARTISKSGSAGGGYIVISSATHLGASLGTSQWKITGNYVWITGLTAAKPGNPSTNDGAAPLSNMSFYSFDVTGSNNKITNCDIKSPCGVHVADGTVNNNVMWNDFTSSIAPLGGTCVFIGDIAANSNGPDGTIVARNKYHNPNVSGRDNVSQAIYMGNSKPGDNNTGNNRTIRFVENFVEWVGNTSSGKGCDGFYMKRGCEVSRNYISTPTEALTLRHGGYSNAAGVPFAGLTDAVRALWQANYIARGDLMINDTDHLIIGNFIGGSGRIDFRCGGSIPPHTGPLCQAASRTLLIGNSIPSRQLYLGSIMGTGNHEVDDTEGGLLEGVKNYSAGLSDAHVPTGRITRQNVKTGTAGYEELTGNGGRTVPTTVTKAELAGVNTGCDR